MLNSYILYTHLLYILHTFTLHTTHINYRYYTTLRDIEAYAIGRSTPSGK